MFWRTNFQEKIEKKVFLPDRINANFCVNNMSKLLQVDFEITVDQESRNSGQTFGGVPDPQCPSLTEGRQR